MKLFRVVVTVLVCLGMSVPPLGVAGSLPAKRAAPPTPQDLAGVWIGFWEDGEFNRLDLRADSTGYCAHVAPLDSIVHQSGVDVYRITQWRLDGWELKVSLVPVKPSEENIYLRGRVNYDSLHLQIGGSDRQWRERLMLYKESEIQALNRETKERIQEAENKP